MRVLLVDDEAEHREYLSDVIGGWGHEVSQAADGHQALQMLSSSPVDVLLTDLVMPRVDGFELLKTLGEQGRLPPSVVMTAFGSLERALQTIHDLGGFWFLEKPIDLSALQILITRAGTLSQLAAENQELRRQLAFRGVLGDLIGASVPMARVFDTIRQVAPTSASVLITGESGTGKELVARAIHDLSRRSAGPFVAVNCAAIPETLIESELFGHERGSFTGAVDRRIGSLESAKGGTLFLDEIGEMPTAMQAKLLRVLENFQFSRLGSRQELKADVRFVAATNREPLKAIQDGKFREDLYYRINVFHIELPPLRDRKEDIPLIVEAMIHNLNRKHDTRVTHATPEFLAALQERAWEGNVRELRNVVERAVILSGSGPIGRHSSGLQVSVYADKEKSSGAPVDVALVPIAQAPARIEAQEPSDPKSVPVKVGMTVAQAERLLIEQTLTHVGMNKTRAAAILDLSTKTLHAKVQQYRLSSWSGDREIEATE